MLVAKPRLGVDEIHHRAAARARIRAASVEEAVVKEYGIARAQRQLCRGAGAAARPRLGRLRLECLGRDDAMMRAGQEAGGAILDGEVDEEEHARHVPRVTRRPRMPVGPAIESSSPCCGSA